MRKVKELIDQVADTDAPVLIEGEGGVGKSLVARALHAQSARRDRPLVQVNCAVLPADLLEIELFGDERGAFSGDGRRKPGKFEVGHGGTIVLDEVGEIPSPLQSKLLQVLRDGSVVRLGSARDVSVAARILSTSRRPLAKAVLARGFRADLYDRLNVIRMEIPPLRERREEIPLLAEHFNRMYAALYKRPARSMAPELLACFLTYDWPDNVWQLENFIRSIVSVSAGAEGSSLKE